MNEEGFSGSMNHTQSHSQFDGHMGDGLQQQISLPTEKSKAGGVLSHGNINKAIVIKESNIGGPLSEKGNGKDQPKVVNYETFESSSEDEFS